MMYRWIRVFVYFSSFFLVTLNAFSQILVFPSKLKEVKDLDRVTLDFISQTLHVGKTASNLDCEVKVRDIKQERKFSDGLRIVEMLELRFRTSNHGVPEQKAYFPINSRITREIKNSRFAGTVEEIQLESDDIANSRFIFQHDGNGQIVWMTFEDDFKPAPCQIKR